MDPVVLFCISGMAVITATMLVVLILVAWRGLQAVVDGLRAWTDRQ